MNHQHRDEETHKTISHETKETQPPFINHRQTSFINHQQNQNPFIKIKNQFCFPDKWDHKDPDICDKISATVDGGS